LVLLGSSSGYASSDDYAIICRSENRELSVWVTPSENELFGGKAEVRLSSINEDGFVHEVATQTLDVVQGLNPQGGGSVYHKPRPNYIYEQSDSVLFVLVQADASADPVNVYFRASNGTVLFAGNSSGCRVVL